MNARRAHHLWTRLRKLPLWLFVLTTILFILLSVTALRANNEHMVRLRAAVYAADQNSGDVQGALNALQAYVTAHMNTDLSAGPNAVYPPVQLKYTYDRLVQAQSSQLAQTNATLYPQAQAYCQAQDPTDFSGHNRVPCIEQFVQSHGAVATAIPTNLYEFDFISPKWSPDLAGWSIVLSSIVGLMTILLAVTTFFVKQQGRRS